MFFFFSLRVLVYVLSSLTGAVIPSLLFSNPAPISASDASPTASDPSLTSAERSSPPPPPPPPCSPFPSLLSWGSPRSPISVRSLLSPGPSPSHRLEPRSWRECSRWNPSSKSLHNKPYPSLDTNLSPAKGSVCPRWTLVLHAACFWLTPTLPFPFISFFSVFLFSFLKYWLLDLLSLIQIILWSSLLFRDLRDMNVFYVFIRTYARKWSFCWFLMEFGFLGRQGWIIIEEDIVFTVYLICSSSSYFLY